MRDGLKIIGLMAGAGAVIGWTCGAIDTVVKDPDPIAKWVGVVGVAIGVVAGAVLVAVGRRWL